MLEKIIEKALSSQEYLSVDEAKYLFDCNSKENIAQIQKAADQLRADLVGDKVSYTHNLNVNFTNICDSVCLFCGFRRSENDSDSYVLDLDDFEERLLEGKEDNILEVCLQGGLYSKLQIKGLKSKNLIDMYAELLTWIKDRFADVHIHAYSPEEIDFLSILSGKSNRYVLEYFKDSGLDSIPGTAAEILTDDIRSQICSKKLNTKTWCNIISLAHKLDIPSTATILFGHIESNQHRAQHLNVLRQIQLETNGFTEFIPLAFIPDKTLLTNKVIPLTPVERLKMLAISRLFFKDLIPNIQASWVKQGMEETAESLDWGVNDLGGTLGDERITHAAGGTFGRKVTRQQLIDLIELKSKKPILRDTLYNYVTEPACC